jgi:hypothetical protein
MITFFLPGMMDEAYFRVTLWSELWRAVTLAISSGVSVALCSHSFSLKGWMKHTFK